MAGGAAAAGMGTGFNRGLASARQRRLEEEDRAIRDQERDRRVRNEEEDRNFAAEDRVRRHEREDVGLEADRLTLDEARHRASRRDEDDEFEDTRRRQQVEQGDLTLAGARRTEAQAGEDRLHTVRTRELQREKDEFGLLRERTDAANADADRQRQEAAAASAGLPKVFQALKDGADPNLVLRRYNENSPKQLASLDYDPSTGLVRLTDDDGDDEEFTLDEWMQAYPMPPGELEKLGKDDRLVDPRTGRTVVDSATGAEDSGRDTSPYNPETVGNQLRGDVVRSAGGQLGPLGEIMGIADPEARRLVDFQVAQATAMEGRLRAHVRAGRIGTGQISQAVIDATKGISSDADLAKRAEQWRTDGLNKTPEQAAAWMESERAREQAEAAQKLAEAEQRLLGTSSNQRPSAAAQKPAWAGSVVEGVDAEAIWPGGFGPNGEADEVDVDIDGRKTTIRLGPDGKVYEVKSASSPQAAVKPSRATPHRMAGDDPVAQQVNLTLADARSSEKPFLY